MLYVLIIFGINDFVDICCFYTWKAYVFFHVIFLHAYIFASTYLIQKKCTVHIL